MITPLTAAFETAAFQAATAHPYPLIRGGGLFLMCVGAGFLLCWIFPKHWIPFAIGGGIAGFTASGLSALLPKIGTIQPIHIIALVGSMVLEMGLLYLAITKYKESGERKLLMAILFVVGLHFIPMGLAHGPLIAILGVLCCLNAVAGFRTENVNWRVFGVIDALLKLGFGAWMFLFYPAFTYFS